jgi:hypothetical protein
MSTKTLRKRIALVAVSAMGFGLVSTVPAFAADSTGTASVGPVRVSFTGSTQDAVNPAQVTLATTDATWLIGDVAGSTNSTLTVALTTAPSAAAALTLSQGTGDFETVTTANAVLGTSGVLTDTDDTAITVALSLTGFGVKASVAGTYVGTITVNPGTPTAAGTDNLVVPFSFTTVGAPTSYTFTNDVDSSAVGGAITSTVRLLDANLATTQGSTVDTFGLTVTSTAAGSLAAASATDANLTDGVHANVYTNSATAATTSTLTAI